MSKKNSNRAKDVQGAGQLTVDTIIGITNVVETMHHTITSLGGILSQPEQTKTKGITGLVYKSIRAITETIGNGLDVPLNQLGSVLDNSDSSLGREAMLAALNGVLGDYLVASNNPLAIPMQFRREGQPLSDKELSEIIEQSHGRLIILVHGLCMNDLQWNRSQHDHGAALSEDLGIPSIYLHYNTGLHTSENGKQLAELLEALHALSVEPLELFIVAHSMGGLVSRSAYHYGNVADHTWLMSLKKMVFLGTPHHGAPLEKAGNWIDNILEISPYSAPFARLGKIRSSGVTDLRYGNILDEDWNGKDRFESSEDPRTPVPLPEDVLCYAFAATTRKEASKLGDTLVGDGLVTVNSALGRHPNPQRHLLFPETHQEIGREMNHLDLLNHPEVYTTVKKWLTTGERLRLLLLAR